MSKFRWFIAAVAAVAFLPVGLAAQETGTVTGTVTDEGTGNPIGGVQVFVEGTNLGTLSGQDGSFNIGNVPAGEQEVRATILGYTAGTQNVTVQAGEEVAANFALEESAVGIEGFVVTATGERQRRRELGNTVSQINVADLDLAPVNKFTDVLQGRAAGVTVQGVGGTSGTGSRIRIRGSNSVSLSNEPLLVIDGVRVHNSQNSTSIGRGGQNPTRLDDINPADIENIEILKGPAAAALYGTAAANGVIQITTRRGQSGEARWNFYTEQGTILERTQYPANFRRLGTATNPATGDPVLDDDGDPVTVNCPLNLSSAGQCAPGEIQSFNPIMEESPFRDGYRQRYGMNVSGGTDDITYYLSGEIEDEDGIYPTNTLDRVNLRANVTSQIRDDLEAAIQLGYLTSTLSLPSNDNSILGMISAGLLGSAVPGNTQGYLVGTPDILEQSRFNQQINRTTGSINANYNPLEWLSFIGQAGMDVMTRNDMTLVPPNVIPFGTLPEGSRAWNIRNIGNYTGNLGATASFDLTESIRSSTSVGTQFTQETFRGPSAFGAGLLGGTSSLAGTSARFAVNETNQDIRTLGAYVQQQVGFNDRIFLTGAVRGDDDSAFGEQFGLVLYPSLSASWVLDEENWFPENPVLSTIRLRTAYGRSGLRPGFRQATTFFNPVAATVEGSDVPAFETQTFAGTGNPDLRPEISDEVEVGFDAGLFGGVLGLELTYFDKLSRDALIQRRLAPSLGLSRVRFENLGRVQNQGVEAVLNAQILNLPRASWDATLSVSGHRNELLDLGEDVETIIFGRGLQRHDEGLPLGAFWGRRLVDFNVPDDGIVTFDDVELSEEPEFLGSPFPTREISFSTSATLFDAVRVSALFDHQGGHSMVNGTRFFRCTSGFLNCEEAFNPDAPAFDQARRLAGILDRAAYVEDASFTKLREVSLTLMAPRALAQRMRVDGLSLTLSGRNLVTWTDYSGFDPEVSEGGTAQNFFTSDFLTQPPVQHYTARINLTF